MSGREHASDSATWRDDPEYRERRQRMQNDRGDAMVFAYKAVCEGSRGAE